MINGFVQNWYLPSLLALVAVVWVLFRFRRSKWIFTVWFPSLLISVAGMICNLYGIHLLVRSGSMSGPEGGHVEMGGFFIFCLSAPLVLFLAFCLWLRPTRAALKLPFILPTVIACVVLVLMFVLLREGR